MPKLYKNHTKVTYSRFTDEYSVYFDGVKLPRIKQGQSIRQIFGGEKFGVIVKVDKAADSDLQHDDKTAWRQVANSEDRDNFIPVLESGWCQGRRWTCQPFVPFTRPSYSDPDYDRYRDRIDEIASRHGINDMHSENWGVDELDNVVIFDYGLGYGSS